MIDFPTLREWAVGIIQTVEGYNKCYSYLPEVRSSEEVASLFGTDDNCLTRQGYVVTRGWMVNIKRVTTEKLSFLTLRHRVFIALYGLWVFDEDGKSVLAFEQHANEVYQSFLSRLQGNDDATICIDRVSEMVLDSTVWPQNGSLHHRATIELEVLVEQPIAPTTETTNPDDDSTNPDGVDEAFPIGEEDGHWLKALKALKRLLLTIGWADLGQVTAEQIVEILPSNALPCELIGATYPLLFVGFADGVNNKVASRLDQEAVQIEVWVVLGPQLATQERVFAILPLLQQAVVTNEEFNHHFDDGGVYVTNITIGDSEIQDVAHSMVLTYTLLCTMRGSYQDSNDP